MATTCAWDMVLAEAGNPAPEEPPASGKLIELLTYVMWLHVLVGAVMLGYAVVLCIVASRRAEAVGSKTLLAWSLAGLGTTAAGILMHTAL